MADLSLLKKITINGQTAYVVRSDAIEVYPTANRGQKDQIINEDHIARPINLESRLQTEHNLSLAPVTKTYIEEVWNFNSTENNITGTEKILSFYINGYHFKIKGLGNSGLLEAIGASAKPDNFYAVIHYKDLVLVPESAPSAGDSQKTRVLLSWYKLENETVYNADLDTADYFYGLAFIDKNNIPNGCDYVSMFIKKQDGTYTVDNSSLLPSIKTDATINNLLSSQYQADNITSSSAGITFFGNNSANIFSTAEGQYTKALGIASHAEGGNEKATGEETQLYNEAQGKFSHAEGTYTTAVGKSSHAEGYSTTAYGEGSHAAGNATIAVGKYSHAEGFGRIIDNAVTFGERVGESTRPYIYKYTKAQGISVGSILKVNINNADYYLRVKSINKLDTEISFESLTSDFPAGTLPNAMLVKGIASGNYSHAEGINTTASGNYSHAEGINTTASGDGSHSEGINTTASGVGSHAEGTGTIASEAQAHAEGSNTIASGAKSHAEGFHTTASGPNSHAEGDYTEASGNDYITISGVDHYARHAEGILTKATKVGAHAEGYRAKASGDYSHAEGEWVIASGDCAHAEGSNTIASGAKSHAEGIGNGSDKGIASGDYSHAEGTYTTASGESSHAEGVETTASGPNSHAEGNIARASGESSHSEGGKTAASGTCAHAEGSNTKASGDSSHAEGDTTTAFGNCSHAEGFGRIINNAITFGERVGNSVNPYTYTYTSHSAGSVGSILKVSIENIDYYLYIESINIKSKQISFIALTSDFPVDNLSNVTATLIEGIASGYYSHSEGNYTTASGDYSHAEGGWTVASGDSSHAEGSSTKASGPDSHAEGSNTKASGQGAHSEGTATTASGPNSHAEGINTTASGKCSHAEGFHTTASGECAHAEGRDTKASGNYSHAGGYFTIADTLAQTVVGKFNETNSEALFIVGGGTNNNDRKNIFTVRSTGEIEFKDHISISSENNVQSGTLTDEQKDILDTNTSKSYILLDGRRLDYTVKTADYIYYSKSAGDNELGIKIDIRNSTWTWKLIAAQYHMYYDNDNQTPDLIWADYGGTCVNIKGMSKYSMTKIDAPFTSVVQPSAFQHCDSLVNANFPACVNIGSYAFGYCSSLASVSFPVCTAIGANAFTSCSGLTSINFPACVNIGPNAFISCPNLTSTNFPACTTIGSYAFSDCSNLTTTNFPACTTIGEFAFKSCYSLTSISFPACTNIGSYAFQSCYSLTSVNFPACTIIGKSAFIGCSNLTNTNFPACTTIGSYAFYDCSNLTSVNFQACTNIGPNAFADCSSLVSANFPACTNIGPNAFADCSSLVSVNFQACNTIGQNAFGYCSNLTGINLPANTFIEINYGAFNNCSNLSRLNAAIFMNQIKCSSVGGNAFNGCTKLTSVKLLSCSSVGNGAFTNTGLLSLDLPDIEGTLYPIFSQCANLSRVDIGSKISSIYGSRCFSGCPSLTAIYLRYNGVVSLNYAANNIFRQSGSTGWKYPTLYVPMSYVASYKANAQYSSYSGTIAMIGLRPIEPSIGGGGIGGM